MGHQLECWCTGSMLYHVYMSTWIEAYMYSDLGCHNNGKDFPTHSPSQNIPSID